MPTPAQNALTSASPNPSVYLTPPRRGLASLSSFLVTERRRFGVPAPCASAAAADHPSERATRALRAPKSENENTTSEGICSGSNAELHGEDTTPLPLSSRPSSPGKVIPATDGDDDDRGLGR